MDSSVGEVVASGLADLFDTNSGTTYGASVAGSVVKEIADNAAASGTGVISNKLGALAGSGENTVLGILKSMARSDVAAPSDVGGTFDPATDSEEALSGTLATVLASTSLIAAAGSVTVVSPVSADGTKITIVKGDDYYNADSRALEFTFTGATLTGTTVKIHISQRGTSLLTVTGVVTAATTCYFELTAAQTTALRVDTLSFAVVQTLASAHVSTLLADGIFIVKPDASP